MGMPQKSSNSIPHKGRCTKCRWYYTWGERFCSSCGGTVQYRQDSRSGAGKGKGSSRQDNRQWPSLPTRPSTESATVQQGAKKAAQPPEPATPRGTDKQAGPLLDPDDLEKFYRFGLSVLGEDHEATKDAKDRWTSAVKAKQEMEQRRKASSTLEKQVHIAKERLGKLQRKIVRAEKAVGESKQAVDQAILQHQQSIDAVQAIKKEQAQAHLDYDALVAQLKAQGGAKQVTSNLLWLVGADKDQVLPEATTATLDKITELLQTVAQQIAANKQAEKEEEQPPHLGQEAPRPPAGSASTDTPMEQATDTVHAADSEPPTPIKRDQQEQGASTPPPSKTQRKGTGNSDTPSRGTAAGSTQCS